MAYTLRPGDRPNDFQFCVDSLECGRTYQQNTPGGVNWYWSIYGTRYRGVLPDDVSVQGTAESLQAAAERFKANWEKLVANGQIPTCLPPQDS
jgi:hypothetical protein